MNIFLKTDCTPIWELLKPPIVSDDPTNIEMGKLVLPDFWIAA